MNSEINFEELNLNATEELEFEHNESAVKHRWVQRGNHLECRTCSNHHTSLNAIPPGHMLQQSSTGELEIVRITPTEQPSIA